MTADQHADFLKLLSALAEAFSREDRTGGQQAVTALRRADMSNYRRTVSHSNPVAVLTEACVLPDALALSTLVLRCHPLLDWTSWAGEGLSDAVSERLYTTELVGPDGHIPAEGVRVGLLVSEKGTDYPVSSHSGEETYLVVAGVAEWTVGGEGYAPKMPGDLVHHPAWAPHGRRTRSEPFLGAWRWSGDLDLSSFSVAEGTLR